MLFGKPKSYLGIDVGAGGVKIVELRKEKSRPVLHTYGYTSAAIDVHELLTPQGSAPVVSGQEGGASLVLTDEKVKSYASAITEVCRAAKTTSKIAVVSLPVSAVFHAVVTLPKAEKEEFNVMLRAEVKKLINRPLEEMALDYQILPEVSGEKIQKVLVNAVPRVLVEFYSKVFRRAGLQLDSLEPESAALCRSLIGKDSTVSMIIDMGAERTNFFIADRGIPLTHHSIEVGGNNINKILGKALGTDGETTEQLKYDLSAHLAGQPAGKDTSRAFLDMFMPVVDPVFKEIQYSSDLFLRQTGNEGKQLEKIILTGGASMLPYLSDYISEQFKLKCYIGDPWSRVVYQDGLKSVLHQIGPRMAVAIGLAMRNVV